MGRSAGFTLVELLVVMVVTGIVAALGMLRLSQASVGYRVEAAREKMIQELQTARAEALAGNCYVALLRMTDGQGFQLKKSADKTNWETLDHNLSSRNLFELAKGDGLTVIFEGFSEERVIFNRRGIVEASALSASQGALEIREGSVSARIGIYRDTGYIERL